MSLNAAIEQKYIPEVEALTALLSNFIARWKVAPTEEYRLLVEAEAIGLFERLIALEVELEQLVEGDHPELTEIRGVYTDYQFLLSIALAKLKALTTQYLSHFNSKEFALAELLGRLKRVKQKKALLSSWGLNDIRYAIVDRFLNYDYINTAHTGVTPCDVNVDQGILTLPVRTRKEMTIKSIKIGSNSNGLAGNSDLEVTTNNIDPRFVLNKDPANWFEYERLDGGPLTLTLVLELPQEQIINHLSITPVNLGVSLSCEIDDILFSGTGNAGTSIYDLTGNHFEPDFFEIKTVGTDTSWSITFLPVKTKSIAIKLKQSQSYVIPFRSGDGRIVNRDRYAIAIKDISVSQLAFSSEGGINSVEFSLPGGLYAAKPLADIWPPKPSLFDIDLEMSFDGGETWKSSETLDDGVGTTVLLQGDETSMIYKMKLSRDSGAFAHLTSLISEEKNTVKVKSLLRTANRFVSPVVIPLQDRPKDNKLFVIQPRVFKLGSRFKRVKVGDGTGTEVAFKLPMSVLKSNIDPSLVSIWVNGVQYDYQLDNTAIGAGEWAFSDDYEELLFSNDLPVGARVEFGIDYEQLHFEERADGYYHKMNLLFDPDKENIDIMYMPRNSQRKTIVLPRRTTVIDLGVKGILGEYNAVDNTFQLSSKDGSTYTEVGSRTLLAADKYFVDYANGVLYLNAATGADTVKATFRYLEPVTISDDLFDIVYDGNRPWGIKIHKDAFAATLVTETMGLPLLKRVDVRTRLFSNRFGGGSGSLASATNARHLSHDYIVIGSLTVSDNLLGTNSKPVEVDFIDGETEFLGLVPMENEQTIAISSGSNAYVEFNLSAGSYWYDGFGVVFGDTTVFSGSPVGSRAAAQGGSPGDYYIGPTGLVTVNIGVGNTLAAGIDISYYYQDPSQQAPNKYSVDYLNGVIYASASINSVAEVTYKAAAYTASYDAAKEISSFSYDESTNTVQIRTENIDEINSLVKIMWIESIKTENIEELKDFFSPLINILSFRFN